MSECQRVEQVLVTVTDADIEAVRARHKGLLAESWMINVHENTAFREAIAASEFAGRFVRWVYISHEQVPEGEYARLALVRA